MGHEHLIWRSLRRCLLPLGEQLLEASIRSPNFQLDRSPFCDYARKQDHLRHPESRHSQTQNKK
jgi:hypothetical protein